MIMSSMSLETQHLRAISEKKTKNVTLDIIIFSLALNVHSNFTIFYNSSNKNRLVLLEIHIGLRLTAKIDIRVHTDRPALFNFLLSKAWLSAHWLAKYTKNIKRHSY